MLKGLKTGLKIAVGFNKKSGNLKSKINNLKS